MAGTAALSSCTYDVVLGTGRAASLEHLEEFFASTVVLLQSQAHENLHELSLYRQTAGAMQEDDKLDHMLARHNQLLPFSV